MCLAALDVGARQLVRPHFLLAHDGPAGDERCGAVHDVEGVGFPGVDFDLTRFHTSKDRGDVI
jgi:hypothetical protein